MIRGLAPVLVLLASSCAPGPPQVDPGFASGDSSPVLAVNPTQQEIEAGRAIVELQCISCHAVRSDDRSRNFLAPPLRTLAERYPVTGLPEAFAQGILQGHPNMPDFRFSRRQITDILAYLQSIQTRQGA